MEAEHVAEGLGIAFPPIVVWRPRDKYLGVGQIEALLELKRICSDLGVRDVSAAKDLLESRISEVRGRLEKLDVSKERIVEKLMEHPNDGELRDEMKRISMSQTDVVKSSNLSVISHELKILENVSTVLNLIPSIIDYAVNVGLKETSDQWMRHLCEDGSLRENVCLESIVTRSSENDEQLSAVSKNFVK
jgi:hypothetical protein